MIESEQHRLIQSEGAQANGTVELCFQNPGDAGQSGIDLRATAARVSSELQVDVERVGGGDHRTRQEQDLAFGGFYSGSPYLGTLGSLPPGEGGLNPNGGFSYMWHSHTEKELVNYDIFPGGMMTIMIVEPPNTVIP